MTRPIDADALFEKVGNIKPNNKSEYELLGKFMNMITDSPTVERPHGEWKVYSHCSDGFEYKCSLCGRVVNEGHWFEQKEILSVYPYCHCGAKMVAVEDPIKWYFGLGKKRMN